MQPITLADNSNTTEFIAVMQIHQVGLMQT